MRTVSQAVIDAMTNTRTVGGRLTVRDTLLRFTEFAVTDTAILGGLQNFDSDNYGTGILRVVNASDVLSYQYVSNLNGTWPAWVNTGRTLMAGSKPAVFGGRIFYQDASGNSQYADFNGISLGTATAFGATDTVPVAFAPTSSTAVYRLRTYNTGYYTYSTIARYDVSAGTELTWPGRAYDVGMEVFDAENLNGIDYVFFSDEAGRRTLYLTRYGNWWSEVKSVIPLDIVDNLSNFHLAGIAKINSKLVATGILKRKGGFYAHTYSFGPDHWTMGRDFYIGNSLAYENGSVLIGQTVYVIPAWGGKFHLIGDTLYYVGISLGYKAPATNLIGYDNANLKQTFTSFNNARMTFDSNAANRLMLDLSTGISSPLLKPGSEVDLEVSYGSSYAQLGKYGIDQLTRGIEQGGKIYQLAGRGNAVRRLYQWNADANYDYWSQAKQTGNPATLTNVVRAAGKWSDPHGDGIQLDQINLDGYLYGVSKPSRNMIVQAQFTYPSDSQFTPRYGVIANYYRETRLEASTRLGKPQDAIRDSDYGHNGIAAIYSPTEYNSAPGIGLYRIQDSGFFKITSWSLTIPANTAHWIAIEFHEGYLRVLYRLDGSTTWTLVGSYTYIWTFATPWTRDQVGRGGLYIKNVTPYSSCYGFNSDVNIIPVSTNSYFPVGETLVIDDEQMTVTGVSPNAYGLSTQYVTTGNTFSGAPHDNPYTGPFTGSEIYLSGVGTQQAHDVYNDRALVVTSGPGQGAVFKITDYDYSAPHQWVPTGTYTPPDTWMDHVGDPAYGYWAAADRKRVFVEGDVSGVVGPGSIVSMVPAVFVTRGVNGTSATTHSGISKISIYRDLSVVCSSYRQFSGEMDISLEEMVKEISAKAGVMSVNAEKLISGTVNLTHVGWDLLADAALTQQTRWGAIANFTITSGTEAGMAFYQSRDGAILYGSVVTVSGSSLKFYDIQSGVPVLQETWPMLYSQSGKITISANEGVISVWVNGRLVGVFKGYNGPLCAFVSYDNATINADWSALDNRVDNFILDMGRSGTQILSRLIGEKPIFFQDDQYGNLHVFRNRVTINAGAPNHLTIVAGELNQDVELATRMRVEGADVAETADYALLQEYGNLFRLAQSEELNTENEFAAEAERMLSELATTRTTTNLTGAADPRLEANDIMSVTLPSVDRATTRDVIVERLSMTLSTGPQQAIFDMEVTARDA